MYNMYVCTMRTTPYYISTGLLCPLFVLVMTGPALCHEAVGERQLER